MVAGMLLLTNCASWGLGKGKGEGTGPVQPPASRVASASASASALATAIATGVERHIITVVQWGGMPAVAARAHKQVVTKITLHHQGENFAPGKDPRQYLRNLQTWSRNNRL